MMLTITLDEYLKLKRKINHKRLSAKYPNCVIASIRTQECIKFVKKKYPFYLRRLNKIAEDWKSKRRFPAWLKAPPIIKVRLLLKALGYSKAEIGKIIKDPDKVEDEDLKRYIWKANLTDYVYSPLAVKFHQIKGKIGEEIIKNTLESLDIPYVHENDIRKGKTPDFYLEKPIKFNNKEIRWIESKAMFGDIDTHSFYWQKQYREYLKLFGNGMVIYWFGHIEGLTLASDGSEFPLKNEFKMEIFIGDGISFDVEVFSHKFLKKLEEILDKFYRGERIVIEWNKWAIRFLSNLGFDVLINNNKINVNDLYY